MSDLRLVSGMVKVSTTMCDLMQAIKIREQCLNNLSSTFLSNYFSQFYD